jgi:transposase-like protein
MAKKSAVEAEERVEAMLALLRREEPAAALARRCQVSEVTIYRWRDAFLAGGTSCFSVRHPTPTLGRITSTTANGTVSPSG